MRIAVFGASGRTGRLLVDQALQRGHQITAVLRRPEDFAVEHAALRPFAGDVLDAGAVDAAVRGHDAVVCVIAPRRSDRIDTCSAGTRNLIEAMQAQAVRRLLCVTGARAAHPPELLIGMVYPLLGWLQPRSLRQLLGDRQLQEAMVRESRLDWTLVRPARLSGERLSRQYRVAADLVLDSFAHLGRADLAHCLLQLCEQARCVREAVAVAH